MPLYEYRCTACHRLTEKRQKFSDPEITVCPHCGGTLERTITAPAVQFKGGGWYADGYGSKKPAAASGGDSAPASSGSADSGPAAAESKGDSTAAAPAPAPAASTPASPSTPGTPSK